MSSSGRTRRDTNISGSVVSFHDIKYTVKVKKEQKGIIKNVSGLFKPGMNAILGPTGSGKTSLLDILANRKDPRGLEGTVLVDGERQPPNFQCVSGYVVQDDVVMGTLTIRENLMFSANLRLPKSSGDEYKKSRVEDTITSLGLEHCADTKVGTPLIRGVSGGERKRTNIGMELVTSPKVLFLDEPTTGLDASTAFAVMALVQQLSRRGQTVIFSIHQPRYTIFRLIDSLMLLAAGKAVYHGPAGKAIDHFSSIGYECEAFNNPPDFFLDVINGDSTAVTSQKKQERPGSSNKYTNKAFEADQADKNGGVVVPLPDYDIEEGEEKGLADTLAARYDSSQIANGIQGELTEIWKGYQASPNSKGQASTQIYDYAVSPLGQIGYLSKRALTNLVRNPAMLVMQVAVIIIFAILVGAIYWQVTDVLPQALQNRVGALFFIIMNQIFGNMSAIELFIIERKIFMHENVSGFYRVSSYFISKVFCDIIPLRLTPVIVFSCISYFAVGFVPEVDKFFIYLLLLFLTAFSASGLSFFMSSLVDVTGVANLLTALCYVIMMLFGGLLVQIDSIAVWLRWLQYLSIIRFAYNGLLINELKDLELCQPMPLNGTCVFTSDPANNYLSSQGIPFETDWDLWLNMVALFSIAIVFLIFTYLRLRFINKYT